MHHAQESISQPPSPCPYQASHGPMDRLTGKIKSFNGDGSTGILASIGGISLAFRTAETVDAATDLTVGQLVTYRDLGDGQLGRGADDVRAHD